jgi:5-methylcytosine-specific restriction endonuclease McrA
MKKRKIPVSVRAMVWVHWAGKKFEVKCYVKWCKNKITPFTFEAGHNVPESKGGKTNVGNLRPICPSCNRSMGDRFTIDEYSSEFGPRKKWWKCWMI